VATRQGKGPASAGPACPHCGSVDTYEVEYGHPGHDVIMGHEPRCWCRTCQRGWGRIDGQPGSPCYSPFWFGEPPRDDLEAAARLLVRYRRENETFTVERAKYEPKFLSMCAAPEAVLARAEEIEKEGAKKMPNDNRAAEAWDDVEDKLDQAISEVMLTDEWRNAPTLLILRDVIEHHAPLPAKVEARRLLDLLDKPLASLDDLERIELGNQLVGVLRFVCHRGRDD
jgi:hypothetical protein